MKETERRNKYFKNKINSIKRSGLEPIVKKLFENLFEQESFKKEIELIEEIKKVNLHILVNMTNGGEGTSGYKHTEEELEKRRKDFQDVKNEFEKRDYILLTEEKNYKNNKQKLKYMCPNNHKHSMSWIKFQQGQGCPICNNEIQSKKRRKDFQDVKNEFEKRNYKLLTTKEEYKNNKQKLKYMCPRWHEGYTRWNDFQQGHGCSCKACRKQKKIKIGELISENTK